MRLTLTQFKERLAARAAILRRHGLLPQTEPVGTWSSPLSKRNKQRRDEAAASRALMGMYEE